MAFYGMTTHYYLGWRKGYRGLYGVKSQSGILHLFQNRSGQVWKAEGLPENIPYSIRGLCPTLALYGLKNDKTVPLNKTAMGVGPPHSGGMSLFLIKGKLHILCDDTFYRIKWRRSSLDEIDLLREFG
jgi:hypothetical protein